MAMRKETVATTSVDAHIGQRMQLRRNMLGITQKILAESCNITFQQIQKYEAAANRISASRLFQIGNVLDAPVSFFFAGLPGQSKVSEVASCPQRAGKVAAPDPLTDPLAKNETLQLINLYWRLKDDATRESFMKLLKSMNNLDLKSKPDKKE